MQSSNLHGFLNTCMYKLVIRFFILLSFSGPAMHGYGFFAGQANTPDRPNQGVSNHQTERIHGSAAEGPLRPVALGSTASERSRPGTVAVYRRRVEAVSRHGRKASFAKRGGGLRGCAFWCSTFHLFKTQLCVYIYHMKVSVCIYILYLSVSYSQL